MEEVAQELAIATVPVPFRGRYRDPEDLRERLLRLMARPSRSPRRADGSAIRRDRPFLPIGFADHVCKMVRAGHVQPDEEHWPKHWRRARVTAATGELPGPR